jgi:hypothetical protein
VKIYVRDAFSTERGRYRAIVAEGGVVLVWDSLAGHYTSLHSLKPTQIAYVLRRASAKAP